MRKETTEPSEMILITQSLKELQLLMSDYVGIVRTHTRLQRAMKRLDLLHEEIEALYEASALSPQLCEVRNLITVGYLIVKEAQFRRESAACILIRITPVRARWCKILCCRLS